MLKKVLFGILVLLFPFMITNAISIDSINMDVYIDSKGNATVIETWDAHANTDTEIYHSYCNIGKSDIILESVTMDDKRFNIIDNWNIESSFEEKSYKGGLYYSNSSCVDICAGITSYGSHKYTFTYKITNLVFGASDSDIVYWTFYPSDNASPNNVYVKIYSDKSFSDDLDVWGYGNYGGTAYVYNGYIEMNSEGKLSSSEHMTILIKFPKNTFTTTIKTNQNFNYYYELAENEAVHYTEEDDLGLIISIIFLIFSVFVCLMIIILVNPDKYKYGSKGSKVRKDVPFFRDIPCEKDLFRAYFVASKYYLTEKKEDFLGSILLKWLKDGNVQIETTEKQVLLKTKEVSNIIFINKNNLIPLEQNLYDWMFEASKDGKLESKEFEKWCSKNYTKILKWFDSVVDYERDLLISDGVIIKEEKKKLGLFKNTTYILSDSLMEEAEQLKGLKEFLKEFTLINERQPIEVTLWNEYLIFAQIFGIADKVAKQFEKLYPEIKEQINSCGYDYNTIYFMNSVSERSSSSIEKAQSYSSGGGGFSSGGGGGGSFGGGGSSGSR